jgi:ketosteroid isomerase-like protein
MQDKSEIITRLFDAFKALDRNTAEAVLSDDFRFTSPYDDAIDKATYFERCWPNIDRIRSQTLEKIFVEGDAAFVEYRCETNDRTEFRNVEFFTFDRDRVRSVSVYFGASYRAGKLVRT